MIKTKAFQQCFLRGKVIHMFYGTCAQTKMIFCKNSMRAETKDIASFVNRILLKKITFPHLNPRQLRWNSFRRNEGI